jgi:hypothetical protein
MKTPRLPAAALAAAALLLPAAQAARVAADVQPPAKRQASVELAERLAQRKAPPPPPADLASPFNPVDFEKPDPANLAFFAPPAAAGPAPQIAAPPGDRETLETLAAQITPSGMIELRGVPRLIIGNKPFEVGTRFTATYNNQDYELELVSIDRTTFTLRYRGEETTRPIKPVR